MAQTLTRLSQFGALAFLLCLTGCTLIDPQARRVNDPWTPEANPPDIKWSEIRAVAGPRHLRLRDGLVVQLAHFQNPTMGTPQAAQQEEALERYFFHSRERRLRGLKVVGESDDGSPL